MPRLITDNEKEEILAIKTLTTKLLKSLFVRRFINNEVQPPKFETNDYFVLPANACCGNKKEGYTTIGIYLFNRFIIEPNFSHIFGYINESITGKKVEEIENKIAKYVYEDKLTTKQYGDYLNRIQWLGGNDISSLITPSITAALLKPAPGLQELKAKLVNENKDAIAKGDAVVGAKIEKELVKYAEDALKDDPGFENFNSKAKASVSNNYKTMNIKQLVSLYSNV